MIWLLISILCFMWVMVWTIIHASLFKQAILCKCKVKGMPLWTLLVPLVIFSIAFTIFLNML